MLVQLMDIVVMYLGSNLWLLICCWVSWFESLVCWYILVLLLSILISVYDGTYNNLNLWWYVESTLKYVGSTQGVCWLNSRVGSKVGTFDGSILRFVNIFTLPHHLMLVSNVNHLFIQSLQPHPTF